jgi:ribonuclease HI
MIEIFTDGACKGNPGPGGWGFVFYRSTDVLIEKSGFKSNTTNNQMELKAVIEALKEFSHSFGNEKMILYTDSSYVKNGILSWLPQWKNNQWKTSFKKPVKNQELWRELDTLIHFPNYEFRWIKAHAGIIGNEHADRLANSFLHKKD